MTDTMTITVPYADWTQAREIRPVTTRWFHSKEIFDVDNLVHKLAGNTNFVQYIEQTNKKILKNPDMFEDMAEKYR